MFVTFEIARRDLVEHRGKKEEVVLTDKCDGHVWPPSKGALER